MTIKYLNGENLYQSFVSGAREVIKNRRLLNDINVFPVADGDTGNNLASTMKSIIEQAKAEKSAKSTMNLIADAALVGARGNSGIIMAQYINGISEFLEEEDEITVSGFAESVKSAFPRALSAISNPVEGTIITVIRDWAEAVYRQKDTANSFYELLEQPENEAKKSLEQTKYKLKVLKNSNVVDSGAKGFVHFIEGFTDFMRNGKAKETKEEIEELISEHPQHKDNVVTNRYCTEALISSDNIDLELIKKELQSFGDSLIVAGNKNKARIHIHTDVPHELFKVLRKKGNIIQQKADDMKRQYDAAYERKYKIALVTDSIADLPQETIDEYQINVIPLNIVMDGTSYLDKVTMTPEIFYTLLSEIEEYPSSAQPSIKAVENMLSLLLQHYDEILVVTIAKEQSGTNSIFTKVAEKLAKDNKRIVVVDSKQNSGAEGLIVKKAAELIHEGKSLDEVIENIEKLRSKTKILVSVNTLKYMVRSGRIGKLTGIFGKIINLKPVISIDETGKGKIEDKAFSTNSNTNKIMKSLKDYNNRNKISRYAIVHANDNKRAEEFRAKCVKILGFEPEYIMNISSIVGLSAGVGSVAVSFMSEEGV